MLMIRLARGGTKHRPFYHIRSSDKRNPRDGRYVEQLGFFNPFASGKEPRLLIQRERIEQLVQQGAQLSERVEGLLREQAMGIEASNAYRAKRAKKTATRRAIAKASKETKEAS